MTAECLRGDWYDPEDQIDHRQSKGSRGYKRPYTGRGISQLENV